MQLSARLRRVESLLQRLTDADPTASEALLSEASFDGSITTPIEAHSLPPLMSLFDNSVFGHQIRANPKEREHTSASQDVEGQKICLLLSRLLPSQEDADLISGSTNAWGLGRTLYPVPNRTIPPTLNVTAICRSSPLVIARTLMVVAIFIQQLPPEFNTARLHFDSPIQSVLQKYLHNVTDLVTSKDDFACTMEGLECLLLQTLFYINDGNLRRAWLSARRSLNVAQFLGLQKSYLALARKPELDDAAVRARAIMWLKAVMVDRFLAPILGLPCGVGHDCFGDDCNMVPIQDSHDVFERKLCLIAGHVAMRNQKEPPPGYTATLEIDEKLDKIARVMGDVLLKIPDFSVMLPSAESESIFKAIVNQIWFYSLTLFLHIPWMLPAFTDGKFEYSRATCLHAARELLKRYLALRTTNNTQGSARVVDFSTVIAAVTLILNQVGSAQQSADTKHSENDNRLVSEVIESMRTASRGPREFMARQGVEVMEALFKPKNCAPSNETNDRLRLTIPFFGPVVINRNCTPNRPLPETSSHVPTEEISVQEGSQCPEYCSKGFTPCDVPHGSYRLSFEDFNLSEPGWLPPLEAWDFDNISPWSAGFGLWDVSTGDVQKGEQV